MQRGSQDQPIESPVEARQGYLDRPVLVVLTISLAIALIVLGAMVFSALI